jgi:hypothetical protein
VKRVVVDHFGGPEISRVVEDDDPRPVPGEGHRIGALTVWGAAVEPLGGAVSPRSFRALLELLREARIPPVVAERLPLSEARRAHESLERSAAKGKLVLP